MMQTWVLRVLVLFCGGNDPEVVGNLDLDPNILGAERVEWKWLLTWVEE